MNLKIPSFLKSMFNFSTSETEDKIQHYKPGFLLWEDDYLMIEIISLKNRDFAEIEASRIENFGEEHFDGNGFTNITAISEMPVKTIELKISTKDICHVLETSNLTRYKYLYYNGEKQPIEEPKTIVYGMNEMGILIESDNETVSNIWFASYNFEKIEANEVTLALKNLGEKFNLIMVDWNSNVVVDLKNYDDIEMYLNCE